MLLYTATLQGMASCSNANASEMTKQLEAFIFTVHLGRTEFTVASKPNTGGSDEMSL